MALSVSERQKRYKEKNPERHKELRRLRRIRYKKKIDEYNRIYHLKNKEKINERSKNRNRKKSEQLKVYNKEYYLKNPEKHRDRTRNWRKKNPEQSRNQNRKRLESIKRATPKWTTKEMKKEIKNIYLNCPRDMEVDHITPLHGKIASGLHVPWNLQYLSRHDNRTKSNKV